MGPSPDRGGDSRDPRGPDWGARIGSIAMVAIVLLVLWVLVAGLQS